MASRDEIITEIEALETHCRAPIMPPETRGSWLRDWCDDLSGYPIAAVRLGCRSFRQSGAAKFPTPGQLLPMVKAQLPARDLPEGAGAPWRPLIDREYDELSLRDKIRHQRILAHEARCKAGPMWKSTDAGRITKPRPAHVRAEDMSPAWRIQSQIAAEHEAEAVRLVEALNRARAAS